jgi:alpha-beta hydrolase superfamily lysophospholipase
MLSDQKPTVVLVHGAFADGSSWEQVIQRLQAKGYTVQAPAIALRGVTVTPRICRASSSRSTGPCCWPAIRTEAH